MLHRLSLFLVLLLVGPATAAPPFPDKTLYTAWSDGRLGLPQPFETNNPAS